MEFPKRLLQSDTLSAEARMLLGAVEPTPSMPAAVAADVAARVAAGPGPVGSSMAVKGWLTLVVVVGVVVAMWPTNDRRMTLEPPPAWARIQAMKQTRYVHTVATAPTSDPVSVRVVPGVVEQPAPRKKGGLAEELAVLDRAKHRMTDDPDAALRHVRKHAREFPDGQLSDLRDYLEVQVYDRTGDGDRMQQLAKRFFVNHPKSALVKEVRATVDGHAKSIH